MPWLYGTLMANCAWLWSSACLYVVRQTWFMANETHKVWKSVQKRPTRCEKVYKRDLQSMITCEKEAYKVWKSVQKRPTRCEKVYKRDLQSMITCEKEAYKVWKRVQKRPTMYEKVYKSEHHVYDTVYKRGLQSGQKRPTKSAKETYKVCKRDLQSGWPEWSWSIEAMIILRVNIMSTDPSPSDLCTA